MNNTNNIIEQLKTKNLQDYTDEEIKDAIFLINKDQLSKVGIISMYSLMQRSASIIYSNTKNNIFEKIESQKEKKLLEEKYNELVCIITNLTQYYDQEFDKDKKIEEIVSIRKELYNYFNSLNSYITEVSYINEICEYILTKKLVQKKYELYGFDENDLDNLFVDLSKYLLDDENDFYILSKKISVLIKILPFRISKEKFFEIIINALKRNLMNYPKSFVNNEITNYKLLFNSKMDESYGIMFDEYFSKVQKYNNVKYSSLSEEELEKIIGETDDLGMEMELLSSFIIELGLITNKLIILCMTEVNINEEIVKDGIFNKWKEFLNSTGNEKIIDDLIKTLNIKIKKLEKAMNTSNEYLSEIVDESLKRNIDLDNELMNELLYTRKVLAYYNDINFEKNEVLISGDENEPVELDYLDDILLNFEEYINRNLSMMNNIERKIRMRRMLSSIEFPFDTPDDFMSYVQSSLDIRVTSKEEIILTLNKIYSLIEPNIEKNIN